MNAGNTMPPPGPINELPGLNALTVYGENILSTIGLNHQLAIGNNQVICINPFGLLAGVPGIPIPAGITGAMGAGMGGNILLTVGANANVTLGQAIEINLGEKKITIEGSYRDHMMAVKLCGLLTAAAIAYAIAYGLFNKNNEYLACGHATVAYQAVVDALLIAIMIAENMREDSEDDRIFAMNELFGVKPNPMPESDDETTAPGWLAGCGAGLAVLAAIAVPLALAETDSQVPDQQSAADAQAGGGSGGGDDDGDEEHSIVGVYTVAANRLQIISRTPLPPAVADKNVITLLATGESATGIGKGGHVEVRGNAGVRITAGPPEPEGPSTSSDQTDGVEITVAENQTVIIQLCAGLGIVPLPKIEMSSSGIEIDAGQGLFGPGTLTLKAGQSSITLGEEGITIKGPLVEIN
jgi:hypothetical protein